MKQKAFFFLFTIIFYFNTNAQCAMCRAVLESEEGQVTAEAVNSGIKYLMIIPYILIGGLGFIIYKKFNKTEK